MIGDESLNPRYFRNPSLFTYQLYAQYRLLGFQPPKSDENAASSTSLFHPPSGVAFVGRLNSAVMGTATVAAVAWIGWRLLGPWTGVIAAAFLGLAFIHVRDSHYATNDVPATFLLILSVAASLEILRRPTLAAYLAAGLFGGLATSTKYNAGFFFVPLLLAHFLANQSPRPAKRTCSSPLSLRERARVRATDNISNSSLLASLALSAVAYLAGTPYTLLDFSRFWIGFRQQMTLGGEAWEGQVPGPSGPLYLMSIGQGIGWVMLSLALVGFVLLARRQPRQTAVLVAFPLTYLLFMLRTELFFVRFALPIAPFLCLFAAAAVVHAAGALRAPRQRLLAGTTLMLVALIQPTYNVILHDVLVTRADTRELAAQWALDNVSPDTKVSIEDYSIRDRRPRPYGGPSWQLDTDVFDVNDVRGADPAASLRGPRKYVVVSSFQFERFAGDAPKLARQTAFYDALEREGRLVATFGPGHGGAPIPFDLEDLYTPFWGLERYERPGPTIRIYEVGTP